MKGIRYGRRIVIGVLKAKDGTTLVTHGAKLIYIDKNGLYMYLGGVRVKVERDALQLMAQRGEVELLGDDGDD